MSSTIIGNTMGEDKISSPKQRRDIMKFYSEVTKKLYDTPELVQEAEDKAKAAEERASKLKEMRAERAKEVTDAYDRFVSLREAFLKEDIIEQDLYEFEGMKFTSFKNYDLYLRRKFGDYEKDPEESQKVTHHQYEAYWK